MVSRPVALRTRRVQRSVAAGTTGPQRRRRRSTRRGGHFDPATSNPQYEVVWSGADKGVSLTGGARIFEAGDG